MPNESKSLSPTKYQKKFAHQKRKANGLPVPNLNTTPNSRHTSGENPQSNQPRLNPKSSTSITQRIYATTQNIAKNGKNISHKKLQPTRKSVRIAKRKQNLKQNQTAPWCGSFAAKKAKLSKLTSTSEKNKKSKINEQILNEKFNFPNDHFWVPPGEFPDRLSELNLQDVPTHEELIKMAWNENDSSPNVIVIDNGYTLHRHPVAQSTDAIRGKTGYHTGMHAIEFVWEHGQRGTHAVIGLCTKEMRLERPGYCSLIGHDDKGWGWDLTRNRLFHNGSLVKPGSNIPITSEKENGNNKKDTADKSNPDNLSALQEAISAAAYHMNLPENTKIYSPLHEKFEAEKNNNATPEIHPNLYHPSNLKMEHYPENFAQNLTLSEDLINIFLDGLSKQVLVTEPSKTDEIFAAQISNNATQSNSFPDYEEYNGYFPKSDQEFPVPPRIVMILDCDNGWCGFCADGKWLGVAFSNLKNVVGEDGVRRLPGPLYPTISCVWGNCEVSMKPLCSIGVKVGEKFRKIKFEKRHSKFSDEIAPDEKFPKMLARDKYLFTFRQNSLVCPQKQIDKS